MRKEMVQPGKWSLNASENARGVAGPTINLVFG
jgi:hypothetical protein